MKRNYKLIPILLTLLGVLAGSCKKNEEIGADLSFISVYNATTDVTSLSFLINNESIGASSLSIGQKVVYYGVYAGVWSTEAIPSNGASTPLKKDMTFTAGEHNSLFVVGNSTSLDYFIIKDDVNIKDPDRVKIKFLNLSPNAGSLNLEVQLLNTVTKFSDFEFEEFSDYQNFIAGTTYTLTLKDSANATVGTPLTATFVQGKVYTVWAKGSLGATVEGQQLAIQISEVN